MVKHGCSEEGERTTALLHLGEGIASSAPSGHAVTARRALHPSKLSPWWEGFYVLNEFYKSLK